jgi:hypothetical protein
MDEPDELSEDIKKLEERKADLEKAKESYLRAQAAIPYVQQDIELTDWQIRLHKNRPPEAAEIPKPSRKDQLELENQYLRALYPVAMVPPGLSLYSGTAVTTSSSSADYSYANRVRDLGTPAAVKFGNTYITEYHQLQFVQERPKQVRDLLGKKMKSANLFERFDRAHEGYLSFRSNTGKRTAAANEMRNLLWGFKGELWNLARRFPEENMTWEAMSARVAINGGSGTEHVFLSAQKRVHSSLLGRLADVLKDREGGSITNLESIWTEILDHLYTVLGLIK